MIKNKVLLLATIAVSLLIIYLSLYFDSRTLEKLTSASSFISSFASLITLMLAILLFKKYGIEKNIKDKNLDRIEELLKEISKVRLIFQGKNHWSQFFPLQKEFYNLDRFDNFENNKLVVTLEFIESLNSIISFSYDPFLPKEIARAIDELKFTGGTSINSTELATGNYARGSTKFTTWDSDATNFSEKYIKYNNFEPKTKQITLKQYKKKWHNLIKEIHKWLNANSSINNNLNIDIT